MYSPPLTLVVMVMRRFTIHPLFGSVLISGLYLACFCVRGCLWKMSLQYVNLMNRSVWEGRGLLVFGFGLELLRYIGYMVLVLLVRMEVVHKCN